MFAKKQEEFENSYYLKQEACYMNKYTLGYV